MQMPFIGMVVTALLFSGSSLGIELLFERYIYEDVKEKTTFFWAFNGLVIMFNMMFYIINFTFLWIAFNDANRRNYLMEKLSNSLEFDFHKKDSISVRLPTINFLDPRSLLTWLEARKIILEMGIRFQKRVHIYVTYWIMITAVLLSLLFAALNEFIDPNILSL